MTGREERTYLAAADILRVFSIGIVAWFHLWQQSWLNPYFSLFGRRVSLFGLVSHGYMYVDWMLLLSGFLLFLPYARRQKHSLTLPDTTLFYKKRFWRIVPSYYFAVLAAFVLIYLWKPAYDFTPVFKDLFTHLTFTHVFSADTYLWTNLNGALWTVAVEVQFYLLFPFIARAFLKKPGLTFTAMLAVAFASRYYVLTLSDVSAYFNQLPCMLDLYAFGMLAAYLAVRREEKKSPWALLPSLAAFAGMIWIVMSQHPTDAVSIQQLQILWRLPIAVLGAIYVYFGALWPTGANKVLGNPVTRFLSAISYNFYMWHQYLAVKLREWHIPPYFTEMPQRDETDVWRRRYMWISILAGLALAAVLTYCLEKPLYRAFEKREKRGLLEHRDAETL